jgi:plasmid stabilization system protein ParE
MADRFVLTPRAVADLDAIWSDLAEDNAEAADRVEAAILAACAGLALHPLMGTKRVEITILPVRF